MAVNTGDWKRWARQLKQEIYALFFAYRDPRLPWYARLAALGVVAYAFSPIDLIPDPIPILGYLDDLILIPLGVMLAIKLIPPPILAECRQKARTMPTQDKPVSWAAAGVIILIWLGLAALAIMLILEIVR
jgi:uncharacterized membrane protein YkvA (DUF1232 family)